MQYKLVLVIALAARPRVPLLDEPFGPIDAMSADVLSEALRSMVREHGCGVLPASHQLDGFGVLHRHGRREPGVV